MLNGAFEQKIKEIDSKLFKEGLDSLTDRELQLLLLHSQNKELLALNGLGKVITRGLLGATSLVVLSQGATNWDKLLTLITTIASATGAK